MRPSVKFKLYKRIRRELANAYPALFPMRGTRLPLKVGILKDIVEDGMIDASTTQIRMFLSIWVNSTAYLKSVTRRSERVGLKGEHLGKVSDSHASEARKILDDRRSRKTPKTLT
jgi:sRNA-binding protein